MTPSLSYQEPHLEADTRSPQILGNLHLLAAGTGKKSPALLSFLAPLGLGPVPLAHALGTDEEGQGMRKEAIMRNSIGPGGSLVGGVLTNNGQELPDISCQIPIHDLPVEYVLGKRTSNPQVSATVLPRLEDRTWRSTHLPLTICN